MPLGLRLLPATNGAVDDQDDDGADHRADELPESGLRIDAEELAEITKEDRAADAQQDGDDDPARILTRHDELRNDSRQQANDDQPKPFHDSATPYQLRCSSPLEFVAPSIGPEAAAINLV